MTFLPVSVRVFVFLTLTVLSTAIPHAVHAQSEPPAELPSTTITFMSWEKPVTGLFTTVDGKTFTEIHCPAYQFGRASKIKSGNTLQLYREIKKDDGLKTYEVAQSVTIPAESLDLQAYIAQQPHKDGAPVFRVVVMPNDIKSFPAGDIRVFNFTPFPAMVRLGEDSHPLQSLGWKQVRAKPDLKYRVILMTALQIDGNWIEGGRELMSLRPEYRGDVLVVHTRANIGFTEQQNNARALTITETQYVVDTRRHQAAQ